MIPVRRVDAVSQNTQNILNNINLPSPNSNTPSLPVNTIPGFVHLAAVNNNPSFSYVGMGLWREAGVGDDYGRIWVKKEFENPATGLKEAWLVVYTNDDDEVVREVTASISTAGSAHMIALAIDAVLKDQNIQPYPAAVNKLASDLRAKEYDAEKVLGDKATVVSMYKAIQKKSYKELDFVQDAFGNQLFQDDKFKVNDGRTGTVLEIDDEETLLIKWDEAPADGSGQVHRVHIGPESQLELTKVGSKSSSLKKKADHYLLPNFGGWVESKFNEASGEEEQHFINIFNLHGIAPGRIALQVNRLDEESKKRLEADIYSVLGIKESVTAGSNEFKAQFDFGYDVGNISKLQSYLESNYVKDIDFKAWVGYGDDTMNFLIVYNKAILKDETFKDLLAACHGGGDFESRRERGVDDEEEIFGSKISSQDENLVPNKPNNSDWHEFMQHVKHYQLAVDRYLDNYADSYADRYAEDSDEDLDDDEAWDEARHNGWDYLKTLGVNGLMREISGEIKELINEGVYPTNIGSLPFDKISSQDEKEEVPQLTVNKFLQRMQTSASVRTAADVNPKNIPIAQGVKSKNISIDESGGAGSAKVQIEFTDVTKGLDFYQNFGKSEAPAATKGEAPQQATQPQQPPQPLQVPSTGLQAMTSSKDDNDIITGLLAKQAIYEKAFNDVTPEPELKREVDELEPADDFFNDLPVGGRGKRKVPRPDIPFAEPSKEDPYAFYFAERGEQTPEVDDIEIPESSDRSIDFLKLRRQGLLSKFYHEPTDSIKFTDGNRIFDGFGNEYSATEKEPISLIRKSPQSPTLKRDVQSTRHAGIKDGVEDYLNTYSDVAQKFVVSYVDKMFSTELGARKTAGMPVASLQTHVIVQELEEEAHRLLATSSLGRVKRLLRPFMKSASVELKDSDIVASLVKKAIDSADAVPPMRWLNKDNENIPTGAGPMLPPQQVLQEPNANVLYDSKEDTGNKFQTTIDPSDNSVTIKFMNSQEKDKFEQALGQGTPALPQVPPPPPGGMQTAPSQFGDQSIPVSY